jgi:hypothetical protein
VDLLEIGAVDLPAQKGFYDSKRQFQGKDSPEGDSSSAAAPEGTLPSGIPRGQLIAGVIFLGLIVLAFFKFALPEKPAALEATAPATAAAPAAHPAGTH